MVWRMRDFEPDRDISIQVDLLLDQGQFPPDAFMRPIHQAEEAGGVEGLRILREVRQATSNPDKAPDALDFRLAVRRALETSTVHPVAAYIAFQEGMKQPGDLLGLPDLSPGIRRYLIDAGGLAGSPPEAPRLTVTQREPTVELGVLLSDSDADLPAELAGREAVWFQAWAVDGRGNRTETPVTRLALQEPPATPAPGQAAVAEPRREDGPRQKSHPPAAREVAHFAYRVGLAARRGPGSSR